MMPVRPLGSQGMRAPIMGLGCMRCGSAAPHRRSELVACVMPLPNVAVVLRRRRYGFAYGFCSELLTLRHWPPFPYHVPITARHMCEQSVSALMPPTCLRSISEKGMYARSQFDAAGSQATIDRALQLGVTMLDTAESYGFGDSEEFVGASRSVTKCLPVGAGLGVAWRAPAAHIWPVAALMSSMTWNLHGESV